jgi:methionyl-tRNA formyltransferase
MGDAGFVADVEALQPDISIVVAFGRILPVQIIDLPPQGTLNVHASLLPKLRGAAPIQAAIRDGLTETGVSIMRVVPALDAGPVLLRSATPIAEDETFGELQLRLSELGALALLEALTLLSVDEVIEEPQDDSQATYAPKIEREMARIDWGVDCDVVGRMIRAYDPRPAAFTTLGGADVKLFGARPVHSAVGDPGVVTDIDESGMLVACRSGGVRVAYVHPAGKRRLASLDWAQGRGVRVGDRFGTTELLSS